MSQTPIRFFALMTLVVLLVAGCRGESRLPTVPVSGCVTCDGKPLYCGEICFRPKKGPAAKGVIQSDGTFQLTTYATNDGAVIGDHEVLISCRPKPKPKDPMIETGLGKSLIPEKYERYETSGLHAEVKQQHEPLVFKFDLK